LAIDGDFGDAWQVNQSQVRASWRIHVEHDWFVDDIFSFATNFVRQFFDSFSNFVEFVKLFPWNFIREDGVRSRTFSRVIQS
jgi:hypothetical protein